MYTSCYPALADTDVQRRGRCFVSWYVPDFGRSRRQEPASASADHLPAAAPADFDGWLAQLRDLRVAVPCGGCGGAHEMTCAELLARQLIRGAAWPSEECDDGAVLHALLAPEDVFACGGDPAAVRDLLARRGILGADDAPPVPRGAHRILLSV